MNKLLRRLTMGCVCSKEILEIEGRQFYVRQRLGEGGFSYVDLIEERRNHKLFALKRISCHSQGDEKIAVTEVEYMNAVNHPNLVPCEAHSLVKLVIRGPALNRSAISEALIVMPYYGRGSLQNELESLHAKGSHMQEHRLLTVLHSICEAVSVLHTHQPTPLAHRDLKPHNVMFGVNDTAVLMDFGSMGPANVEMNGASDARKMQDIAAERCSMPYRAPELFSVDSYCTINDRIDIWSLGCTLYAMCFHESPFDKVYQRGDSIALAAMAGKINIPQSNPFSKELMDIMLLMLKVDPVDRPDILQVLQVVKGLLAKQTDVV